MCCQSLPVHTRPSGDISIVISVRCLCVLRPPAESVGVLKIPAALNDSHGRRFPLRARFKFPSVALELGASVALSPLNPNARALRMGSCINSSRACCGPFHTRDSTCGHDTSTGSTLRARVGAAAASSALWAAAFAWALSGNAPGAAAAGLGAPQAGRGRRGGAQIRLGAWPRRRASVQAPAVRVCRGSPVGHRHWHVIRRVHCGGRARGGRRS